MISVNPGLVNPKQLFHKGGTIEVSLIITIIWEVPPS